MIWLSFGAWSLHAGRLLTSTRIYIKGYIWTPFVVVKIRKYFVPSASEALYAFCGWLTSRDERVVMSATNDAAQTADLVNTFIEANNLAPPRSGWEQHLRHPEG